MTREALIKRKYQILKATLNERTRRLFAAAEAKVLGWGGVTLVARATGVSRLTIHHGLRELDEKDPLPPDRIRKPGGGRKKEEVKDPKLKEDLIRFIDPYTWGDPRSPLRWTSKSTRKLAQALVKKGHHASAPLVERLLHDMDYSLQANRKTSEGKQHPDRNAQFEYISRMVSEQQARKAPAISVDAKKKENVGGFKNAGREWRPKACPQKVRTHDFMIKELGKVSPYGVYDLTRNQGWVSVGIDHDTAEFAVESIRRWWDAMGKEAYPKTRTLLITADSGGSNSARTHLWKWELQKFANQTGLTISVTHFPPGTSKWNKIEHRMFSFIAKNWRGKPLFSRAVVVSLIRGTTTRTGLTIRCRLDHRKYPKGIKISKAQRLQINLKPHLFHGDWNYTIVPNGKKGTRRIV